MKKHLTLIIIMAFVFLAGLPGLAQEPYKLPPKAVLDIIDAPLTPRVSMNPARDTMLLVDSESMPAIAYLSQPIYRIAGIRITPLNNSVQVLSFSTGLTLKKVKDGTTKKIALPAGIKFAAPRWSADGQYAVFPRYLDNGIELWVLNIAAGEAKALTPAALNMVVGGGMGWTPDNRHVLVHMVPDGRGKEPEEPRVPIGPNVQVSGGKAVKTATYEDLLKTPYDEKLFDYYATSQIVEVDVTTGQGRKIGGPGIYTGINPSPDGNYYIVTRIKKPYSYSLPYSGFARSHEIWSKNGELVKVVADLPPNEGIPMNGVPTGPRSLDWQPLKPATLLWTEALDGGDPEKDVPFRDKFMAQPAPFTAEPKEVLKLQHRAGGLTWFATPGQALASESNWKKRWRTTYLVDIDQPQTAPRKIFDRSTQDNYADPGSPVMTDTKTGDRLVLQDKDWIYLQGTGASPQGDHPFLDRMDLKTLKKERLFQCQDPSYDTFIDFDGASRNRIFISSESKTEPPNYYILDLKTKKKQALTDFKDPAPQLTKIKKELVKYKRDDGVELSGTLYLPADYKEGQRLPVVIWAYPYEYSDASTAGQIRGSVNRFTFYRGTSQLFYVVAGYALLDNATMPVIGDPKTMNDTFIKQIVANAKAAIDKLDQMGVGDPKRVAVGGHSYGAFMTANLLAHCDLFAAGIARSGAYNRTLTPFGFQSERRTLWEAKDTYINMSPYMFADKIKTPILMIHGEMDDNSGTFPIQSERLFAALKGFGAQARLVMLPYERHGYSARESVLHVLAEMIGWCDTYVKNKK
jgi:dipeptidyl aminopeptidase/acylaminoacyl peptidase